MMQVNLHISLKVTRQSLSVCQCLLLIREAPEYYLQQPDEYYLHPGWKGSRCRHQQHRYRYRIEVRGLCRMRALQEARILISY